jgi:signal transduction histidine kinase
MEKVVQAVAECRPYSVAFIDGRMPPGWDGVQTIGQLWKVDPDLQVVFCTAYADYSWEQMQRSLGNSDSFVVLKKPFDTVEVLQLAHTLSRKREITGQLRTRMEDLDRMVAERTSDLRMANDQLKTEMVERAKAEERLRQSQKMEAIGQLAAGVAHDFNNLLTIIQGHVGLLLARQATAPHVNESLKQVLMASEQAAGLTRQLLLFSHKHVPQLAELDLNAVLTRTSQMLVRLIGEHIQLRLVCSDGLPAVLADECNLEQLIVNLAVNARDAMGEGGTLTLSTAQESFTADTARQHAQAKPGRFLCLSVADTGCGMDAPTLSRIFEPFFTTKEVGRGTGLGLSTVYGIVQQHQGWIEVASDPGQGSTFRIFLPAGQRAATTSRQTEFVFRASQNTRNPATILVVEDEDAVRVYARTVLADNSFRVLEAADGLEALKVWAAHPGQIDLLFTDMVMPNGMSGRALAERLHSEAPGLKVICASGYSAETLGAAWLQSPSFRFLPKPYKPQDLLKAVCEQLQPAKGASAA